MKRPPQRTERSATERSTERSDRPGRRGTGRRRFLGALGASALAPALLPLRRLGGPFGGSARAALPDDGGTIFIEICLRDQWDQMHVFVPPGIAGASRIHRGETGDQITFFAQPDELRTAGGVILTADSAELAPHVDTVAQLDFGVPTAGDIHGHEAANPLRTPGRRRDRLPGYMSLFDNDPASGDGGNMRDYGTVPTPSSIHNHWSKLLDPSLRNGFAFKGVSRSNHTVFHFAAGLPGGELDRIRSRRELFDLFPPFVDDPSLLRTPREADAVQRLLSRVDRSFFARRRVTDAVRDDHERQIDELREQLHVAEPRVVSLPITDEEREYWGSGVPSQMCTRADRDSYECGDGQVKAQIWEQVAYAYKLVSAGMVRTVALEFDYMDLHGYRPEQAVRTQAQQLARPLARLIARLKADGLYERTVIAVYTVDGSRAPHANSYGHDGKNTLILAGGRIRGGYFGDIRLSDEGSRNRVRYHPPDEGGAPTSEAFEGVRGRLDSARIWRTVAEAAGIPRAIIDEYAEVQGKRPYSYLLR
ncbi:MAG: DUF1501 domain-containing protein [Myxococcales bacterium]|nr:DUF1501 domain-containing protein [Myxococcales bacterium]